MIEKNEYTKKDLIWYLKWLSDTVNQISITSIIILTILMAIIVLAQVISRYIFSNSISWSEEIARWLMIWVCFLGSGAAVKSSEHIGLSFIYDRFPKKIQNIVSLFINICIFIFLFFCIVKSIPLAKYVIHQKTPAARISMAWPYSAVPVGSVIMAVHVLLFIFENFRDTFLSKKQKIKEHQMA